MVADRRVGPAGVAAAGRAELPVGDAAERRARRLALAPSRGAGGTEGRPRPSGLVLGCCSAGRGPRVEAVERPPLAMVPVEQQQQHRLRTVAQQHQQSMNGHKGEFILSS